MNDQNGTNGGGLIPQDFIQKLLESSDIVAYATEKLSLKKAASKRYKALCPFHNEKTPSFHIHQDKQYYHCYGCGANGNIINLMMHIERTTFPETIAALARRANLQMPKQQDQHDPSAQFNALAKPLLAQASEFFIQQLKQNMASITYMKKRGLSDHIMEAFSIGYAPSCFPQQFFSSTALATAKTVGLVHGQATTKNPLCYFRNRIIFPIHDPKGHVVGFGGRALGDAQPKYLNSKESMTFHKSHILYGLHHARKHRFDFLMVVEGYMDVLMLAEHGILNAVATLGTAISTQHFKHMLKYTQKIAFCFDGDQAGQRAAWKALTQALPLLTDGIELKFVFMPDQEDPDSYIQKFGKTAFKERFADGMDLCTFFFHALHQQYPTDTMSKKAIFGKQAMTWIDTMQNSVLKQLMKQSLEKKLELTLEETQAPQPKSYDRKKSVVSTTPFEMAVKIMTHYPKLCTPENVPEALRQQDFLLCKIMDHMLELVASFGCSTSAALIEASKQGPYHENIQSLAHQDLFISSENAEQTLHLLMKKSELRWIEHRIDQLLAKHKSISMTEETKLNLQNMLKRKAHLNTLLTELT